MKKLVVLSLAAMLLVTLPALALRKADLVTEKANENSANQSVVPHSNPKLPTIGVEIGRTSVDWPANGNVLGNISIDQDGGVHLGWTYRNEAGAAGSRRMMYNYRDAAGDYLGPTAFSDIEGNRWGSIGCTYDGIGLGAFYATIAGGYGTFFAYDAGAGLGVFTVVPVDTAYANANFGGAWWTRMAVVPNPANSDTIYLMAQSDPDDEPTFISSYDLGQTWNDHWAHTGPAGSFIPDFPEQQIAAGRNGRVVISLVNGAAEQVYRISEDYGVTWGDVQVAIDPISPSNPNGDTIEPYIHTSVFFDNDNVLHILNSFTGYNGNYHDPSATAYVGIVQWDEVNGVRYITRELLDYVQTGGGNTLVYSWPNMVQHTDGTFLVTFGKFDNVDIAANTYANGDIAYVYSQDGGANWTSPYNITNSQSIGAAAGDCEDDRYPDCAVYGDSLHIVWLHSRDAGAGLQGQGTVTYDYIYHAAIGYLDGVAGEPTSRPASKLALNQSRPNPVRHSAEISFNLPKAGDYSLRIYNVAGQSVKEFRGQGKAGLNSVNWNAGQATNGVYFYKLSSGGSTATKRLVVVK
jgi:hypothetical protein